MTTDLTIRPDDDFGDEPLIEPDELEWPTLRWNGKDGEFVNTFTGEVTTNPVVISLIKRLNHTRVKWTSTAGNPPECSSKDSYVPVSIEQAEAIGAGGPQHNSCTLCPFANLSKDDAGRAHKAPCTFVRTWIVALDDDDDPLPYKFSVKSTSLIPMKKVASTITMTAPRERQRPLAFRVELSRGVKVKEPGRDYWPLLARVLPERNGPERIAILDGIYQMAAGVTIDATADYADPDDVQPGVRFANEEPQFPVDDTLAFDDEPPHPVETTAAPRGRR